MPTTIAGLLIFVVLLTPGFVYLARIETRLPGREYSALRETATVVWVSLRTYGVVFAGFMTVRWRCPGCVPDMQAFLSDPATYWSGHTTEVVVSFVMLLSAAVGLAALVAVPPAWSAQVLNRVNIKPARLLRDAILTRRRNRITTESGWGTAFNRYPDRQVYLGLRLKDKTYLYGALLSFDPQTKATSERSLQLRGPIDIRTPTAKQAEPLEADVVIVSQARSRPSQSTICPRTTPTPRPESRPPPGWRGSPSEDGGSLRSLGFEPLGVTVENGRWSRSVNATDGCLVA